MARDRETANDKMTRIPVMRVNALPAAEGPFSMTYGELFLLRSDLGKNKPVKQNPQVTVADFSTKFAKKVI